MKETREASRVLFFCAKIAVDICRGMPYNGSTESDGGSTMGRKIFEEHGFDVEGRVLRLTVFHFSATEGKVYISAPNIARS